MALVRVNGVELCVNRYRTGPPGPRPVVVMIHGLGVVDQSSVSLTVGMPLATSADVLLYDLRGHGRSELVPAGYRVVDHVTDLVALLDELGIGAPVHLVTGSFGGAIGTVAAMRHPERVASLTLVDAHFPVPGWGPFIAHTLDEAAEALAGEYTAEQAMQALGKTSPRKAMATAARVKRLLLETSVQADVRAEPDLGPDDYARIRCPVLGAYGSDSPIFLLAGMLRDLLPAAEVYAVAGSGHLLHVERPREVRALIRGFVGLADPDGDGEPGPGVVPLDRWVAPAPAGRS